MSNFSVRDECIRKKKGFYTKFDNFISKLGENIEIIKKSIQKFKKIA